MAERQLPWFPIAYEHRDRVELLWAVFRDDVTSEWVLEDQYQGYPQVAVEMIEDTPKFIKFINGNGEMTVLREVVPDDAARSVTLGSTIPLPVEVIGAIMSDTIASNPTLSAAVADDGEVHTVILETDLGLYARYVWTWIRVGDLGPLDQLAMVGIPETDLEHYDQADEQGHSININDLSPIDTTEASADLTSSQPAAPVTAAGGPVLIASVDDLPAAIEYATTDESARWYVARRAKALGWTEPLPWA